MRTVCLLLFALASAAHAGGPWRATERNTDHWSLMTPKERLQYQARVRGFSDYEACDAYQQAERARLQTRARVRGQEDRREPLDSCAHLKAPRDPP